MADPAFHDRLTHFSDDVFAGRDPGADALDDADLAQTIRKLKSLDHVPAPQSIRMNQIKESVMHAVVIDPGRIQHPTPVSLNGSHAIPAPLGSRELSLRRIWIAVALVVVLLAAMAGSAYYLRDEPQPAVIPAVQDTATPGSWPNYRGDIGRTGAMPGPGLQGAPAVHWRIDTGGTITDASALGNGMLYVPTDGPLGLVAYDAETGAERWHAAQIGGRPALANGLLVARSELGQEAGIDLVALDATTGEERWRIPGTQTIFWTPVIDDGVIYIPAANAEMHAIDLQTGEMRWSVGLESPASRSAALSEDLVVVGGEDGTIRALNRSDGQLVWSSSLGAGTPGVPAVRDGVVYVGLIDASQPALHAIDLASGTERWVYAPASTSGLQAAAVTASMVYLPSQDGTVSAVRLEDGSLAWRFQTGSGLSAAPVVVDGIVYQPGTDGNVYAIDAETGSEVWQVAIDAPSSVEAIVVDGTVYLSDEDGSVYALRGSVRPAGTVPANGDGQEDAARFVREFKGNEIPLTKPGDIAIEPSTGNLWIADGGNSRFLIYGPDGTLVDTWGEHGSEAGQFDFVDVRGDGWGGVAFGSDGSFYVADTGNFRIQHFDAQRNFLQAWGTRGSDDGEFLKVHTVAVGPDGSVYAIDDDRLDIQQFDADGTFVRSWGAVGNGDGEFGNMLLLLTVDDDGNVWVADNGRGMVHKFAPDGSWIADIGRQGKGDGELDGPADIAVDANGNIYISDLHRVQVFAPDGAFVAAWGGTGSGPGQFNAGGGMALDGNGSIFVVDYYNNRVQQFALPPEWTTE